MELYFDVSHTLDLNAELWAMITNISSMAFPYFGYVRIGDHNN